MFEIANIFIFIAIALVAAGSGVLAGNGAVYIFNKIPDAFFENPRAHTRGDLHFADEEEWSDPVRHSDGTLSAYPGQRIKTRPWKVVFSATLAVLYIYMGVGNIGYAIVGAVLLFVLTIVAMSAWLFGEVPWQFSIPIAVCAVGMAAYRQGLKDVVIAAAVLGVAAFLILFVREKYMKKGSRAVEGGVLGFALGLNLGLAGAVFTLVAAAVLSFAILLRKDTAKKYDQIPLLAELPLCAGLYIFFGMGFDRLVAGFLPW